MKVRDPAVSTSHATARVPGTQVAEFGAMSADVLEVSTRSSATISNRKHNTTGLLLGRDIDQRMHAGGGTGQARHWGRARAKGDLFSAARRSTTVATEEMDTGDTGELEMHSTVSFVFSDCEVSFLGAAP